MCLSFLRNVRSAVQDHRCQQNNQQYRACDTKQKQCTHCIRPALRAARPRTPEQQRQKSDPRWRRSPQNQTASCLVSFPARLQNHAHRQRRQCSQHHQGGYYLLDDLHNVPPNCTNCTMCVSTVRITRPFLSVNPLSKKYFPPLFPAPFIKTRNFLHFSLYNRTFLW